MLNEIQADAKSRMQKSIDNLETNFAKIRTGRAHPSILDSVTVEYYGSQVPISQVANINVEDARTLTVQPWEQPMVAVVEKAIMISDLGVNPVTNGNTMRIPMPALTEERRRDLTKVARQEAENARIAIRNVRRDANNDVKELLKEKDVTEDDARRAEDSIQKLTDDAVKKADAMLAEKEASLMEV
ncbi:ribosome recycling factor [Thiomicrorhabdus lithotrophica]|uniref:Ribosome-recycling factor n=1 Tax=Thiomicrorhabdus lithotrophica TaxID=2949997 RepID=A0ABY8C7P6_9GAMM|nr:ribosome recycling factor [Thiomicrorhabdus lithotrophica]WEJ61572.1 ribosome recycling factor [Thiomicrorhabdus lithotrophica]